MNYIVNTVNGKDVCIGLSYGSVTLKHGDIYPESFITTSFPEFFVVIPEEPVVELTIEPTVELLVENKISDTIVPLKTTKVNKPKDTFTFVKKG